MAIICPIAFYFCDVDFEDINRIQVIIDALDKVKSNESKSSVNCDEIYRMTMMPSG
jgi:hypothetical protein